MKPMVGCSKNSGEWSHFSGIAVEIGAFKELAKLLPSSFLGRKENWKIVLREFLITYPVPQGIGRPPQQETWLSRLKMCFLENENI